MFDPSTMQDRSPLGRLPAGLKLAVALGLVLATALLPKDRASWLAVPAAVLVLFVAVSRVALGRVLRRMLQAEPLALGVTGLALFGPGGAGLAGILLAKSTLCLLAMVLLTATTPFAEILGVLRALRVPALLVTTLALMYRYLFVLSDEMHRMRRARQSRTFVPGRRRTWSLGAGLIAQLFVRASERAERIYAAMIARGWQ